MKKYPPDTVLDMMHHINKTCFKPPLDEREVCRVFHSIRKRRGMMDIESELNAVVSGPSPKSRDL